MVNNVDIALEAFKEAQKRFYKELNAFIELCEEKGKNTVVLSEDIGAFTAMREMIIWAVSLYDRIEKQRVSEEDKAFMSGIKYIDNVLKHEKEIFELFSILSPGIKISVDVEDNQNGPIIRDVQMESQLVWGDLKGIRVNPKFEKQRDNFFNYVKKLEITKSIEKLDMIIEKYYSNMMEE